MMGKMMFIYQSSEMQQMFRRYGNQLVLLNATYKMTKYILPHFFLVTKSNINLQICTFILLQEQSVDRVTRALIVAKMCNPEVASKYAFFDFGEKEIPSLETVYPNIQVYFYDFTKSKRGTNGSIKSIMEWHIL